MNKSFILSACEDGCVDVLLDEIEEMIESVTSLNVSEHVPAPWSSLRAVRMKMHVCISCRTEEQVVVPQVKE